MRTKKKTIATRFGRRATYAAVSSCALVGVLTLVGVAPAQAFSGVINGGALQGNWYYDWTYSKAEGSATYDRVYAYAKQDGTVKSVISAHQNQWYSVDIHGQEWNVDDDAGLYTVQ